MRANRKTLLVMLIVGCMSFSFAMVAQSSSGPDAPSIYKRILVGMSEEEAISILGPEQPVITIHDYEDEVALAEERSSSVPEVLQGIRLRRFDGYLIVVYLDFNTGRVCGKSLERLRFNTWKWIRMTISK